MSDHANTQNPTDETHDAPERGARFRRRVRGYDVDAVEDALLRREARIADLEAHVATLREDLGHAQHDASETRHDLTRSRAELRYWNDRASYVDSEVTRARKVAAELEQAARDRADAIEADAQERSLQLVDRVCAEANMILQTAREEARDMFLRFETDVDVSQQKLEKLDTVRHEIARTMQHALQQFEDAVREMDKVAPVKRIVEALEQPTRRPVPTFGQQKALEAAKKFTADVDRASDALSTPLAETLSATIEDLDGAITHLNVALDEAAEITAAANASAASTEPTVERRTHDADEEFAALLMQP